MTPGVCLGGELVARDKATLQEHGITHIVNCVGMVCPACFPEDFTYLTLYLNGGCSDSIIVADARKPAVAPGPCSASLRSLKVVGAQMLPARTWYLYCMTSSPSSR